MIEQTDSQKDEPLCDTPEAAKIAGLSVGHLEKLRITGGGPEFVKLGRSVRYERRSIRKWIEARRRNSTADRGAA